MDIIIQSNLNTLKKTQVLLHQLSNEQLSNKNMPPYYSSIGTHLRHILDFYDCILHKNADFCVDLSARSRNERVENDIKLANDYLKSIMTSLQSSVIAMNATFVVIDDLGLGKTELTYTYGALLAQANSHTIHHYAIINYILDQLKIRIDDASFGYNPTTPKKAVG